MTRAFIWIFFTLLVKSLVFAKDVCRGPLVRLSLDMKNSKGAAFFGTSASFGRQLRLNETLSGSLVTASPVDACTALSSPLPAGAIVLVQRGSCNFTDKARQVELAGGSAMVMYDNQPGCISMAAGAEENSSDTGSRVLQLPSVSVSQASGKALEAVILSAGTGASIQAALEALSVSNLDGSALVLWLMAMGTLVVGALWAGADYEAEKRAQSTSTESCIKASPGRPEEVVDITATAAVGFVFIASAMLLLIFFFFNQAFFYILLVFFCMAAAQSTTIVLTSIIEAFASPRLKQQSILVPHFGSCPVTALIALPISLAMVIVWAVMRHEDWSWVLQDILGICLMLLIFRSVRLSTLKVACILLPLTFAYDIFWVFLQPLIFGGGKSVMVEVAEGGGLDESLPMLLRVPYLGLPSEFGAYSMLGFGDIILPGLLVAYLRRVDLDLHRSPPASSSSSSPCTGRRGGLRSPWCGYWAPVCVAYGLGLMVTYLALLYSWFGDQGQPALLYLVPSTLGTTLVLGYLRDDLRSLWEGSTSRQSKVWGHTESDAAGDDRDDVEEGGSMHEEEERQGLLPPAR